MSLKSAVAGIITGLALISDPAMGAESQNPILEAGKNHSKTLCYAVKATVAELSNLNCEEGKLVVVPLATIEKGNRTSKVITQIQTIFKGDQYMIQVPIVTQTMSYGEDGEPLSSCLQSAKTPPLDTYNPN